MNILRLIDHCSALRARPWRRRFLAPLSEAAVIACEAQLGFPLSAQLRAFFLTGTGGEEDRGYLGILPLERAVAHGKPAATLVMGASSRSSAALLPMRERDDGTWEAVVTCGGFADTMWVLNGEMATPIEGPSGSPMRLLDWLDRALIEVLADMPAPLDGGTRYVDLAGLGLHEAPPQLADVVQAVSVLLGGNLLAALPEALAQCGALQRLEINDNRLDRLPEWLGDLTMLRRLELARNQISALPTSIAMLQQLVYLGADSNRLAVLSTDGLDALEELSVADNRIERLVGTGPTSLRLLDLGNNRLTSLPDWLGELEHLQCLKVAGNPLRALPASFAGASFTLVELGTQPSLRASGLPPSWDWGVTFELLGTCTIDLLQIAGAPIPVLPPSVARLQRVRRLAVQSASLQHLPDFVADLTELEELRLDDNHLSTLPMSLGAHPRLRSIALYRNPISGEELRRLRLALPQITIHA